MVFPVFIVNMSIWWKYKYALHGGGCAHPPVTFYCNQCLSLSVVFNGDWLTAPHSNSDSKDNPSALLSSWKSMCVFLFVCQLHCRDISSCVLREWITSFVTLGPWSGDSSWLHGPASVSVGPLEQCSTRTFSCWWFWHQWVHSTQYDWGHVEGGSGLMTPKFPKILWVEILDVFDTRVRKRLSKLSVWSLLEVPHYYSDTIDD